MIEKEVFISRWCNGLQTRWFASESEVRDRIPNTSTVVDGFGHIYKEKSYFEFILDFKNCKTIQIKGIMRMVQIQFRHINMYDWKINFYTWVV